MTQESLLSISEASQLLSVSETSLRQWTDEGKIKAFITPGGHRRYDMAELTKLLNPQQKMLGIKDLVVELEDTAILLREISKASLNTTHCYNKLSKEKKERLSHLGRQSLNMIIKYIHEPSKREETVKQAHDVGHEMGGMLAELGLPLTDSVEVFLLHREPIINALTHMMKKKEACTGRVVDAVPLAAHIMDEALVGLVDAHQKYHNGN
ncbi:MAG: helix-turn-helix domain-containing protein [Dehalococcoidales bacterium]|nr:helix-turn-helix domain-containing protein [Dehalococcoidales bacterium]